MRSGIRTMRNCSSKIGFYTKNGRHTFTCKEIAIKDLVVKNTRGKAFAVYYR
jgi:hypothetical protein